MTNGVKRQLNSGQEVITETWDMRREARYTIFSARWYKQEALYSATGEVELE